MREYKNLLRNRAWVAKLTEMARPKTSLSFWMDCAIGRIYYDEDEAEERSDDDLEKESEGEEEENWACSKF